MTREKLLDILMDLNPTISYESCTTLITDRHIDSLMMIALVPFIEEEFDIEIPAAEIVASNFDSLDAMVGLVDRHVREQA